MSINQEAGNGWGPGKILWNPTPLNNRAQDLGLAELRIPRRHEVDERPAVGVANGKAVGLGEVSKRRHAYLLVLAAAGRQTRKRPRALQFKPSNQSPSPPP